jgi:hypothetical protein
MRSKNSKKWHIMAFEAIELGLSPVRRGRVGKVHRKPPRSAADIYLKPVLR